MSYHIYNQPFRWTNGQIASSICPSSDSYQGPYPTPGSATNAEYWTTNTETAYAFPYSKFDATINVNNEFIADGVNPVPAYPMQHAIISEWNIFSNVEEDAFCNDGVDNNESLTHRSAYCNSPFFVYEFGKLLLHATKHSITDIYIHNLLDSQREQVGFFTIGGDPKGMWIYFQKVHEVVRGGYTMNVTYSNGVPVMIEVVSDEQFTQSLNTGWYHYNKVLIVTLEDGVRMALNYGPSGQYVNPTELIEEEFDRPDAQPSQDVRGNWKIYRRVQSYAQNGGGNGGGPLGNGLPNIEVSPTLGACGHVLMRWQHLDPLIQAQLLEIRNLNNGHLEHSNPLQPGTTQQALNTCSFNAGVYVATLFSNGVPVARGRFVRVP